MKPHKITMSCLATVEQIKLLYRGVPEDGFQRDVECSAEVITKLHRRTGMDFDEPSLTVKGLQIVRGSHCTSQAYKGQTDQHLLQNWETEDFIVFENIYYGTYSTAIFKTMNQHVAFPVYICDKTKSHTRFFKAGLFTIIQSLRPDILSLNANGHTIRGYLLLQKYIPPLARKEKKQLAEESKTLSSELGSDLIAPFSVQKPQKSHCKERDVHMNHDLLDSHNLLELQPPCPRPTTLFGITFKSLLEARFATFLMSLGMEFTYEKSMFSLESYDRIPGHTHTYHPDFYIKALRVHVELKPHFPHLEELDLCEQLASIGYDVVLFHGTSFVPLYQNYGSSPGIAKRHYNQQDALRGIGWSGQNGGRLPGEAVFVDHDTHITIECITNTRNLPLSKTQSPRILAAFEAARALK
jgi:hypothetical protein